jgi:hypothetical protein
VLDVPVATLKQTCWTSTATSCKVAALCVRVASRRATGSLEGAIMGVIEAAGIVLPGSV